MPRVGLTPQRIVDEAALIADEQGFDHLTLASLASRLSVRVPSLYKHVNGLPEVKALLSEQCRRDLVTVVEHATIGRAGDDAIRAMALAIRNWAKAHPGKYAATVPAPRPHPPTDPESEQTADHATTVLLNVMSRGYLLSDTDLIHKARAFRSAVHGFVALELADGFGLAVDVDESFAWMIDSFLIDSETRVQNSPDTT